MFFFWRVVCVLCECVLDNVVLGFVWGLAMGVCFEGGEIYQGCGSLKSGVELWKWALPDLEFFEL